MGIHTVKAAQHTHIHHFRKCYTCKLTVMFVMLCDTNVPGTCDSYGAKTLKNNNTNNIFARYEDGDSETLYIRTITSKYIS